MTSAQKRGGVRKYHNFADKQLIRRYCGQRGKEVKKSHNCVDVIREAP